jgi:hypothetical protein
VPECQKCSFVHGLRESIFMHSHATLYAYRLVMDSVSAYSNHCLTFWWKHFFIAVTRRLLLQSELTMMIILMMTTNKNKVTLVLYGVSLRALSWLGKRIACYVVHHKCALVLALTSVFLLCAPERNTGLHRNRYCKVLDRKGLPLA